MKKLLLLTGMIISLVSVSHAGELNKLSDEEKAAGFELLFNGKDFTGWKQSGNWKIEEGVIARKDRGGSLVYAEKKVPDNFVPFRILSPKSAIFKVSSDLGS